MVINMGKFNMDTIFSDALKDDRVMQILKDNMGMACNHPRFREAYEYSFREILNSDMGAIVGLPKSHVKKIFKLVMELE